MPTEGLRARFSSGRQFSLRQAAVLFNLLLSLSCSTALPPVAGVSRPASAGSEPAEPEASDGHGSRPVPPDVVARSALPFRALRTQRSELLATVEFFDELAEQDAICIGEQHDNPHHHFAQLYVVQELAQRAAATGRELGLGMEMFQTPFQAQLDAFALGKIEQSELIEQSEYPERWGYPFAFYAPQIEHVVDRGGSLVALNAPRERVKRVAREGFQALSPREERLLGGYDLYDEAHRAQFDALMKDHPHGAGSIDQLYAAQVLWDESMAQAASDWLGERQPARQLVILAGAAHCHESAIPSRLERRLKADVVSVKPVVLESASAPPEMLLEHLEGYDYGFFMSPEP